MCAYFYNVVCLCVPKIVCVCVGGGEIMKISCLTYLYSRSGLSAES